MRKNGNRRFKHNRDKIKTGDVYELAEVVRNLAIRESEKGLSTGEKQMYTRAKKILASELMYALEMEEEDAEAHLETLIEEAHVGRNGAAPATAYPPDLCPSSGSFPPAAAANALAPTGPRRSSFWPARHCLTARSPRWSRSASAWWWPCRSATRTRPTESRAGARAPHR